VSRRFVAIVGGALSGGLVGAICLLSVYAFHPDIDWELDRDFPGITQGIHPVELDGQRTVRWTEAKAMVSLPGLDRHLPWACSVTLRGPRPAGETPPTAILRVDGVPMATVRTGNQYQPVDLVAPPAPRDGLVLAIDSEPAMIRGERVLGVQIDRLLCRPSAGMLARAPWRALGAGAASAGLLGAVLGAIGMTPWGAALGAALLAAAQAFPLSRAPAPYTAYPETVLRFAYWIALLVGLAALLLRWRMRRPLSAEARVVVALSGAMLYLDLVGLFHPMKLVVDALFHANRLEWVLHGRYYFTQPMPSGVEFPYAIALYLFAAPWSSLTTDLVGLLRVLVCASQVLAGALLYPLMVRAWGDKLAATIAVALLFTAPVPYLTIGYANLTFAFGQSAVMATLVTAAWPQGGRRWPQIAGLFALTSLAFLSHVGIFPVLFVTLVAAGLLYLWRGRPSLSSPGRALILVATLSAAFSLVTYYGHFEEAYVTLRRVTARASLTAATSPVSVDGAAKASVGAASPSAPKPIPSRLLGGLVRSVKAVGWPAALLAVAGVGLLLRRGGPDRLALTLAGGGVAYVLFFTFASVTPVAPRFLKYNDEFIGRLSYLILPIVAILGARGAAWGWRARGALRLVTLALGLAAGAIGFRAWLAWFA
jgi:hypothetical protein